MDPKYVVDCLAAEWPGAFCPPPISRFVGGVQLPFRADELPLVLVQRAYSILRNIVVDNSKKVQRHDQGKVLRPRTRLSKPGCVMTYGRVWWGRWGYIICRCDWQATTTEDSATAVIDQRLEYELMTDWTPYRPRSCALIGSLVRDCETGHRYRTPVVTRSKLFCAGGKAMFSGRWTLGHY